MGSEKGGGFHLDSNGNWYCSTNDEHSHIFLRDCGA